jgi:hypothetical protein
MRSYLGRLISLNSYNNKFMELSNTLVPESFGPTSQLLIINLKSVILLLMLFEENIFR